MFQSYRIASWVVALGLAVIVSGCSSQAPQEKQKATMPAEKSAQVEPAAPGEHAGHATHEGHQRTEATPAGVPEGLAELSADDRAAAEKQRVCPVSGDVLGAQGKPYKVTVKGQTVFLCCPDCEKQLKKNPDKYLAKMKVNKPE
jgi:YHS domain-containing protein